MIRQQGVWSLGDGHSIHSFTDSWVPTIERLVVKPRVGSITSNRMVADWIYHKRFAWREEVIWDVVDLVDVEVVLNVTIQLVLRSDILRWPHTRNGRVSVRSTYHSLPGSRRMFESNGTQSTTD